MEFSNRSKRRVQILVGVGSSMAPFMVASMVVAAPTIGRDFQAEVSLLGWIAAAFFLTAGTFLLPFGRIADIRGSKRIFSLGLVIYIVSATLSAFAPNIFFLILGRAVTGLGAAMVFGTSVALIGLVFPLKERGRAIGINVTAMFIGFTLGLLAGGFLTYYVGWRSIFFIAALVSALDLLLILRYLKGECEISRSKDYDLVGMGLYATSIILILFGLSEIVSIGKWALLVAVAPLLSFIIWERRYPHPLIDSKLRKNRALALAVLSNILFQAGSFAIIFLLSLHLQYVYALDSRTSGILLIIPSALTVIIGPLSGKLSDLYTPRLVATLAFLISICGLLVIAFLSPQTPLYIVVLAMFVNGLGIGFFLPSILDWALSTISRENYGVTSALSETARLSGMTLSNSIVIVVFGLILGNAVVRVENLPQFVSSIQLMALIYTVISLIGLLIAFPKGFLKR